MEKSILNSAGEISPETRQKMRSAMHIMALSLGAYPYSVLVSQLNTSGVVHARFSDVKEAQEKEVRRKRNEEFNQDNNRFAESHGFADFEAMNEFVNGQLKLDEQKIADYSDAIKDLAAITYFNPKVEVKMRSVIPPKYLRKRKY